MKSLLALGWLAVALSAFPAIGQTLPCKEAKVLGDCKPEGCAAKGTPEAEANAARQARDFRSKPVIALKIDHFEALQAAANTIGLQGFAIPAGDRKKYRNLQALDKKVGEGDFVEINGFIVGMPHARRTDSANCRLVGRANNSYRINIAELPDDTEFDSILVEMIPQQRLNEWTLEKLRRVAQLKKRVRVAGQLFYDSKHLVNSDPTDELIGHPKRLSLWEIHPVSEFRVCIECATEICNAKNSTQWIALEKLPPRASDVLKTACEY